MKKYLHTFAFLFIIVSIAFIAPHTYNAVAGSLTPSGVPAATSYTLSDIYNKLSFGTSATAGNHSLSTSTSPAASFFTLTQIYNAIPGTQTLSAATTTVARGIYATTTLTTIDSDLTAANIVSGTTIFGIAGSASSGNATVAGSVPILPVQAWVDSISKAVGPLPRTGSGNFSNKGISSITQLFLNNLLIAATNSIGLNGYTDYTGDFSGNNLDAATVNAILASWAYPNYDAWGNPSTLNLSGGTNAAPTGQGLIDKSTLEGYGWTVLTN